jgi:DNA uptake protein ComE-like DNA-binding protein
MIRNFVRVMTVLCALCLFAGVTFAQAGGDQSSTSSTTTKKAKSSKKSSTKKVDINSASKEELVAAGLDDATAQKVIDGRPYKTKRDLVTKNILTQDDYDKVKDKLVAHRAGGKMGHKKAAATTK